MTQRKLQTSGTKAMFSCTAAKLCYLRAAGSGNENFRINV